MTEAIYAAQSAGVLPLTSVCNLGCVFCSNRFNPAGVEVYRIAPRELSEIRESLQWLPRRGKIVIGESATRIIEGEPLTHPRFLEIIRYIRRLRPSLQIQVTTNATLLTEEIVAELADLGGISFVISLNCLSAQWRQRLLGSPSDVVGAVQAVADRGLRFDGSVVAMPHLTGWEELEGSVEFLIQAGAQTVRIMEPGFTKLTPKHLCPEKPDEVRGVLEGLAAELSEKHGVAVLVEPAQPADLRPVIEGVVRGSPAHSAGLRRGDVVEKVNGVTALSRAHAFQMCLKAENPVLRVYRGGERLEIMLRKRAEEESGIVMYDDISYDTLVQLAGYLSARRSMVIATSTIAAKCVNAAVETCARLASTEARAKVLDVQNRFFGGSIRCAGLLTAYDIMEKLETELPRDALVVLPQRAFDWRGRDLTGRSYSTIWQKTGRETILI
ncbi:MAG TPA: DUF512 domain-containing protein [Firmicutes bacterium]|nr:DUF512 domain-containing protein [Bacillota bacterium]